MRALEYLAQLYPDKTGKELLEIQKKDIEKEKKSEEKRNKKKLDFIKDLNFNGGFYKGAFGTDQYFMYKITDVSLENNRMMAQVEEIVLFYSKGLRTSVLGKDSLSFEIISKDYENLENYGLEMYERINEEEYNKLHASLDNVVPSFFKKEFEIRKKEFSK